MKKTIVSLCGIAAVGFADPGTFSLEQALERARAHSPELRAAQLHSRSAEALVSVAGLWENPILEFEAENLGWNNDGLSEGEYTLALKQEFQLGGKRGMERTVALAFVGASGLAMQERTLELDALVRQAFVDVMFQQETGKVRAEQEELARAFVEVAKLRLRAGGGSELDVVQAELALEETILQQTCCLSDLLAAQERLASLVGIPVAELGDVTMAYYDLDPVEGVAVDDTHPALRRLDAAIGQIQSEARYAKAQDIANVSLGAGFRYEASGDVNTFLVSASMPLSFHKRGRAAYAAGQLRADAAQAEREEVARRLRMELASLLARYTGACKEVELTKEKLLPKAEQAYELTRAGYDAGRYSWMERIDALQHRADIRIRYIESLCDAHRMYAQLQKFTKEGIRP